MIILSFIIQFISTTKLYSAVSPLGSNSEKENFFFVFPHHTSKVIFSHHTFLVLTLLEYYPS